LSNQARRKRIWATRLEGWRREKSAFVLRASAGMIKEKCEVVKWVALAARA
jgi:hypothetical protein